MANPQTVATRLHSLAWKIESAIAMAASYRMAPADAARLNEALVLARQFLAETAPGHTDLMVSPESLDAFMAANPLPTDGNEEAAS